MYYLAILGYLYSTAQWRPFPERAPLGLMSLDCGLFHSRSGRALGLSEWSLLGSCASLGASLGVDECRGTQKTLATRGEQLAALTERAITVPCVLSEFFTNARLGTSSPIHLGMGSIQLPVLAAVVRRLTYELWVKCLQYSVRMKWTATVDVSHWNSPAPCHFLCAPHQTPLNVRVSFQVDQVSRPSGLGSHTIPTWVGGLSMS
ncbi:hypothetical protein EDB83DRAFT_467677 [Lactarius deliciosus]|nr:hypothetical protein EDB83DRAFT_467677 [Lactarius deliciosus]